MDRSSAVSQISSLHICSGPISWPQKPPFSARTPHSRRAPSPRCRAFVKAEGSFTRDECALGGLVRTPALQRQAPLSTDGEHRTGEASVQRLMEERCKAPYPFVAQSREGSLVSFTKQTSGKDTPRIDSKAAFCHRHEAWTYAPEPTAEEAALELLARCPSSEKRRLLHDEPLLTKSEARTCTSRSEHAGTPETSPQPPAFRLSNKFVSPRYTYSLSRRRGNTSCALSADIMSLVFQWLPLPTLPGARRVNSTFRNGVIALLARDQVLERVLHQYLHDMLHVKETRVWVAVRSRPHEGNGCCILHRNSVMLTNMADDAPPFYFDAAFDESASQLDVWQRVQPRLMRCILRREHACLFAYGQTGSGKTHTLFGTRDVMQEEGIAFRVAQSVRTLLAKRSDDSPPPVVEFSFLEVYNEKVYDLLAEQHLCHLTAERELLQPGTKFKAACFAKEERVTPKGLTRRRCNLHGLDQEIDEWLLEGFSSRQVGHTVCNERSSRSHAVATIHICWRDGELADPEQDTPDEIAGLAVQPKHETRLYLVDLAGSERAGQNALSHSQLNEGVHINRSLSTLGRVVGALARGDGEHVPYRDSTLTWLLSDAITGRSARAFMVAAVHPSHAAETLSTLRYAQQYSSLRSDLSARIQALLTSVRCLQRQLGSIRNEFNVACSEFCKQTRGGHVWDPAGLQQRVVRVKRGARQSFKKHPYLRWTDEHWGKMTMGVCGVLENIVDRPQGRLKEEAKDGRRIKQLDLPDDGSPPPARCVRVVYAGRHGRPCTTLWYPSDALDDVPPPAYLRELWMQVAHLEEAVKDKLQLLRDVKERFAAEQRGSNG